MKHKLKTNLIISAALLVLASPVAAIAQTSTSNTSADQSTSTTTLAQRIAARQAALKTTPSAAVQLRIKTKCKAAQVLINTSKTNTQANIDKRSDLYAAIIQSLQNLITRLKSQNIDTVELGNVETQLQAAAAQYKADNTTYSQSLTDIATIDCVTDPVGFKVTLDSLRAERATLAKDAAAVRALHPALTKALADAKVALANKQTTTGSGN